MRFRFLCLVAAAQLLSAQSGGTIPRANAADYPAHAQSAGVSAGGITIAPAQSHKILGKDIDRAGYIVIEVAIYPEAGQAGITPSDFSLRIGSATVGPVGPDTIIAAMQPAPGGASTLGSAAA